MALRFTRLAALVIITACGAVLNQALVVQVASGGAPAAHRVVQFLAVSAADSAHPYAADWIDPSH